MRVGLVCPYTWEVPGGVQLHVAELAEALIGLGHDVSVITPSDDEAPLPPYAVSGGKAIPVPYNGSVARLAFGFLAAARVRRWLREGAFDIVHVHEPAAPSLSLLACWAADAPLVATFHTANPRSRAMSASAAALQTALEKISGRIAVSEAARTTLVEHLGGDAVLIPNGVPVAKYAQSEPLPGWPGRLDGRLGGAERGGVIGFLGRMDEQRKGLPVLLRAFGTLARRRPGLRLLLVGPGPSDVLAKVDKGLRERITVLGKVSEADKVRAYHSVDVFCAPNLGGESFGMVLTEAMAAGAAILASDIAAFRSVLRDGEAGELFRVGDPDALVRGAERMLDEPALRERLSAGARAAVRAYDWTTVAADVAAVYQTVLPAARPSEPGRLAPASPPGLG